MLLPRSLLAGLAAALLVAAPSLAQGILRHQGGSGLPILAGAEIPPNATTFYLSGQVPPVVNAGADPNSLEAFGDTKTQAIGTINRIKATLEQHGYTMGDVVKMQVFLVPDPTKGNRMDFKGWSEAYAQFFGTPAQPNTVARSTMAVAGLVNPGWLVEVEVTAAKVK